MHWKIYNKAFRISKSIEMQGIIQRPYEYAQAAAYHSIGTNYYLPLENYIDALSCLKQALSLKKRLYGKRVCHTRTGETYRILAHLYKDTKRYESAAKCAKTALKMYYAADGGLNVNSVVVDVCQLLEDLKQIANLNTASSQCVTTATKLGERAREI